MATIFPTALMDGKPVPLQDATLSVASAAVLYGLSVYTVFRVVRTPGGMAAFRVAEHEERLRNSARIIGLNAAPLAPGWLLDAARTLVAENGIAEDAYLRATLHARELLPGVRARGVETATSVFAYATDPILSPDGVRLKTSTWRRVPDQAIPSRAKVNGAYVNSVLAKQDALDSGYDDAVFLDAAGHLCELSAANLFFVRGGTVVTPSASHDILEGISRRTVIEIAQDLGYAVEERVADLTELYIADEAFACGTSAALAPILEVDGRKIGSRAVGPVTEALRTAYRAALCGADPAYARYLTPL